MSHISCGQTRVCKPYTHSHSLPVLPVHVTLHSSKIQRHGVRLHASKNQEPDLIERMVGAIFGKKALEDPEPFGLKRINFEELPDQFVEMKAQAKPVPGDTEEVALFRPLLARTQLENKPLRCDPAHQDV